MIIRAAIAVPIGLFALFLSFPVQQAEAAAVSWDGGGDGSSWSDPLNWSGDTLPTSTDDITIDGNDGVDSSVFLDIDFTIDVTGSITITAGDVLTISPLFININHGTINNDGHIENGGTINNDDGGIMNNGGTIRNSLGTINNQDGGTINNSGTIENFSTFNNINEGTINNQGSLININGIIDNNQGSLINNDGVFDNINGLVNNDDTIENGGTININGIIDNNQGSLINNDGTINIITDLFNVGTLNNDGSIENGGDIDNNGIIDNDSTINNNAGGTITNRAIIQNAGAINNECGATFDDTATLVGNPVNNDECGYGLNLFENGDPSDLVYNLGQEARAVAETSDPVVTQVTFRWNNPSGDTVDTEIVLLTLGSAESTFTPNEVGMWEVEADFGNGVIVRQTVNVPFSVVPESAVGVIALVGSSLAALGVFAIRKKHGSSHNRSVDDLGI